MGDKVTTEEYVEVGSIFVFTLAVFGGIIGFGVAAVSGNAAIGVIVGLLAGAVAGIANAGNIKRFK